jgi:hypothetical protein
MKFQKGISGNPTGRPPGIADKRTELSKLLLPHAEQLVSKVIELALAGDINALRMCIERLIPRIKDETINIELANLDLTCEKNILLAGSALLKAVSEGLITPEQGKSLSAILETQRKSIELSELTDRLSEIENVLKLRKKT